MSDMEDDDGFMYDQDDDYGLVSIKKRRLWFALFNAHHPHTCNISSAGAVVKAHSVCHFLTCSIAGVRQRVGRK